MENSGALEMNAKSNIKGVDKNGNLTDTLYLKNVDVTVGGTTPNAAVKNLKVASDTNATISGGNITSGDISINAESNSNVEISSTGVTVSAVALSGGSSIYKNNSNTLAQIGSTGNNTTINANNVSVNTKSTSKSDLVTRAVGVRVAGIAGVNILENIDNNSSLAKITGNTNITANGTLSTHSTINTDLKSRQNTVEVSGADIAAVFRNETNASTISKSLIEAVNGTIQSKNINLVSDYGVMKVANTVDSTQVKGVNVVGHDKAIVKMNSTFESGINAGSATINNSANLKIETAKKSGSEGITATNTLDEVVATIANFFSGTFGETNNTAKSNTYLVAGNNQTGTLTINSYLDSLAKTTTGTRKGGAISVNSAYAESTDLSTLNLTINGTNKIIGGASINVIHNATASSDLEALNVGVGVQGQRARVSATQTSNTIGNIAGDYSANSSDINFNTNRNSYISKTTRSGGAISVNDAQSNNTLNGDSTLNVNISNASNDLNNKMTVKNTSTNTFDIKSRDTSGGVINVSVINDHTTLNTKTTTNISNANIKAKDNVSFEVSNNTLVDDTGTASGGGFIAVLNDTYTRTYTSGAYLNLTNSEIHANDIKLNAHSDISAKRRNEFDFKAGGGGFVAVPKLTLHNYLNQTSEINLNNTKLYAKNNAVLSADTSSWFKVKSDTDGRGFVSVPKVWSYLDPTYTHKITLDSSSIINAANDAVFNFNSNNTLSSKVSAYSWLNLNINNTLDNRGKIHAGNLADINFMTKSYNDLANHINTENRAAVAKTYEDGNLLKRVINNLKVPGGAEIVSDKDIEVTYSGGRNNFDSNKTWRTISYAAFGIPIDSGYKTTHPVNNIVGNSLELNGLMKAGNGGSKKITIDKAGNIVADKTEGFTSSDYSLSGGEIVDGKTIKDQKIAQIQSKINKATSDKEEVTVEIENLENSINIKTNEKENAEKITADFNSLISGDYKLLNSKIPDGQESSEFYNFVINDFKAQITGSEEGKLLEAQYKALGDAYGKEISAIYEYNQAHKDSPKEYMSISDFLSGNTSLGLSDVQKNTVKTACDTMGRNNNGGMTTANDIFDTYIAFDGTKYAGVTNPTEADNVKTCDEVTGLSEKIVELTSDITTLTEMAHAYTTAKENLTAEISTLTAEKTAVENTSDSEFAKSKDTSYSIVFNDIISNGGKIKIDGTTNKHINGEGIFSVAGSGLQVDNYSTRSLIFDDIDLSSFIQSGLYIDGKNYQEFLNKEQAVNGTDRSAYAYMYPSGIISFIPLPYGEDYNTNFDAIGKTGVHYISNGANVNSGIVINNYYDTANPFASSQNIPNPTLASDITFNGKIATNGAFNVFNDSGSISLNNFNADNIKGAVNLISTKGNIDINSKGLVKLNDGNNIFAGNAVNIKAGSVNSSANITAGYNKDLTLTITNEMLNNLAYDPVTGENILINLGNTPYANASNNIKAVYKDGQIHLYNINNDVKGVDRSQRGKVNITAAGSNTINNDKITAYDKYQKITVNNQTDKQLNVYNVTNSTSNGGYYLNGNKVKDAQGYSKADTSITSTGKLVLDGVIRNAVKYENDNIVLDSSPNDPIITHDDQGNISLVSEINDSTLLLRSNGAGLELKKQAKYVDIKGNTSSNSIYAAGLVALYNDDKAKSGGDEASSNMIVNGDIEAQGNVLIYQDTKGTLDVNSTIHQLKHTDDQKGYIAIVNNNNGSGALTLHENTFLHNEQGDIVIANLSNSAVNIDGVLYAPAGNVYTYSNGGTVTDSATTVVSGDIEFYNEGDSSIIINGINATSNGNIIVENTQGNLEITENGSLLNFSETAKNIDIRNTASGDKLTIAGTVANYSGGNINVENNGTGNAEISGYIYNKDGSINIDNKKNDLSITGIIDTDNGNVTIQNEGKALNIGNVDTQNPENNKKAVISVENGNLVIENNGTDRSNMTISAEIYHNSIDNTKSGNITVTNGENAGAFSIIGTEISSQGTNTEINIVNNSSYNDNDENNFGLAIQDSSISQRDGKTSIINGLSGLAIEGSTIKNTEQGNISITNSQGLLYTDENSNIINKNGEINIANVGGSEFDGILSLQGTIQNETNKDNVTANTKITNSGTAVLLNADIENYGGNTSVESSFGYIGFDSNILNTGGDITIKNTATDATTLEGYTIDGVGISGVMVNTGGDINISNSNGDLYIDKESYIYNTSLESSTHNTNITNTGRNLEFYGNIASDDGNIEISNSDSAMGALTVTGNIGSETGIIAITNESEHGMVIDSTANIQNKEGDTVITNTQGSAVIKSDANIVNIQGGDITVSNSGVGLAIEGSIENQGTGKITVVNEGTDALTISENAQIYASDGDISISNSNDGALNVSGNVSNETGKITITNNSSDGMIIDYTANIQNNDTTNTEITNTGGNAIIENGAKIVNVQGGDISVSNSGVGLAIDGLIENQGTGEINLYSTGTDALAINETGILHSTDGNIEIVNSSTAGIDLIGSVKADKQNVEITNSNGDLRIGGYADSNDSYITAVTNNVIINQTGGSILNGVAEDGITHQHHDLANANPAYKTLISANGDITFNVTDGDIGSYSNTEIVAGTSFDASTRDYTESINVQANGLVNAKVVNNTNTDDRLINLRAKESDLKIGTIEIDGNVILTAADWKQADIRPVDKSDTEYFSGYSMLNGRNDNNSNIIGKNISLITSGSFGTTDKKLIYEEDTLNGGSNVSLSAEAENGLHLTGRSNSDADVKVSSIISKHGSVDIDFESNAEIEHITADDGLLITQKAQNLTIKEFGTSGGSSAYAFNDILYPHDDIAFDDSSTESAIPKYVDIKVLDAINNSDRADSTLKIYTGYVKGNNGDNTNYYPNGANLADITLMADNIYAMSDKMQTPTYADRVNLGDTSRLML